MATNLTEHDKAVLNCVFNPHLPLEDAYDEAFEEELKDVEENTPAVENTKKMEVEAINAAEAGRLKDAIDILNKALAIAPKRASLYNNRAQVYQLLKNYDEALNDLTQAIKNAGAEKKRTLRQALCQRGLLYRKKEMLEEARADFNQAAEMGSKFAKNQLVEMNPYAALCNQMLRHVVNQYK